MIVRLKYNQVTRQTSAADNLGEALEIAAAMEEELAWAGFTADGAPDVLRHVSGGLDITRWHWTGPNEVASVEIEGRWHA